MTVADAVARLKITLDDVEPMQHLAMRWRREG